MKLAWGDTVCVGDAVDASDCDHAPAAIAEAIRAPESAVDDLRIESPAPTTVYDHIGLIGAGMRLSLRGALAAAARSRGERAPQDEHIERLRADLAELPAPAPAVEFTAARRALAATGADEDRLRERVASLRGRLQATEAAEGDAAAVADLRETLVETAGELARVETERIAATQRLSATDRRARAARTDRERRLRLRDRLDNCRRAARADLAERVRPRFRHALEAVPALPDERASDDPTTESARAAGAPDSPSPLTVTCDGRAVDTASAALAVARLADYRAPVVLTVRRFPDVVTAADWLDGPVILR